MTPQQFLAQIKEGRFAPAYLFLGPEPYQRDFCRRSLIKRYLPDEEARESALARHDLDEMPLAAILDDARSPSLFAPERLILASNAEDAVPKVRTAASDEGDDAPAKGGGDPIAAYMRDPTPGVVLVFEAAAYGFQGEDKKRQERVRKFYAAIPAVVEFAPMSSTQARQLAQNLAQKAGLRISPAVLESLVEALGGEAARIASEIEKLRLYTGAAEEVTAQQISELIPDARETTVFALVDALGRRDRARSLDLLQTLVRQGEYLPLALNFLATQFRLALAAKDAGLRTPQQISSHFSKSGVAMWPSRAEQIYQTTAAFSKGQCREALKGIYAADKGLRDVRPDDRVVMEQFILALTRASA